jgi:chaperonin GroEL (HSP60 family)
MLGKVRERDGAFGFNAEAEEYEDLVTAGIIDPTKVVRSALENAASIAGLMVTTECLVAEAPEKEKRPAAPPPPEDTDRWGGRADDAPPPSLHAPMVSSQEDT